MKKLGTLKLKNASVLSEREMKQVLGGSGFTGSGSEEREWDCLCFQPHSGALGEDNTPLPPDKKVTVKSMILARFIVLLLRHVRGTRR